MVLISPESIGSFSNLRYTDTSKGPLATVSNDSSSFECHLYLNDISSIKMLNIVKFEKELNIIRFVGSDERVLLSVILNESSNLKAW